MARFTDPLSPAFSPASIAFSPASIAFSPCNLTLNPASLAFSPASSACSPASITFSPASLTFSPASLTYRTGTGTFLPHMPILTVLPDIPGTGPMQSCQPYLQSCHLSYSHALMPALPDVKSCLPYLQFCLFIYCPAGLICSPICLTYGYASLPIVLPALFSVLSGLPPVGLSHLQGKYEKEIQISSLENLPFPKKKGGILPYFFYLTTISVQ